MLLDSIAKRFRIDNPDKFRLSECNSADHDGLSVDKKEAKAMLAKGHRTPEQHCRRGFTPDGRWSVLIVFQAHGCGGQRQPDQARHERLNPQGVEVHPFKQPSAEELGSTISCGALLAALPEQRTHRHF